jgi:hypothetical protein
LISWEFAVCDVIIQEPWITKTALQDSKKKKMAGN